jgi:isopentenyl-diphosphate delta-isomerase
MSTTVTVTQAPAITADNVLRLFPEVNTALIGGSHNSARNDNDMEGYDEEQIRLMDEVCIVLDENDLPIGSASKKVCEFVPNATPDYAWRSMRANSMRHSTD